MKLFYFATELYQKACRWETLWFSLRTSILLPNWHLLGNLTFLPTKFSFATELYRKACRWENWCFSNRLQFCYRIDISGTEMPVVGKLSDFSNQFQFRYRTVTKKHVVGKLPTNFNFAAEMFMSLENLVILPTDFNFHYRTVNKKHIIGKLVDFPNDFSFCYWTDIFQPCLPKLT